MKTLRIIIPLAVAAWSVIAAGGAPVRAQDASGERVTAEEEAQEEAAPSAESSPAKSAVQKAIEEAEREKERERERRRELAGPPGQAGDSAAAGGEGKGETIPASGPQGGTVTASSGAAPVRLQPECLAAGDTVVTPNGVWVLVANPAEDSVLVLSARTNELVSRIQVGAGPVDIAVSADGRRAYVACWRASVVSEISLMDLKVAGALRDGSRPVSIALSPSGREVYVANYSSNSITVFEVSSRRRLAGIPVGTSPSSVSVSPDGRHVYVLNSGDGTVSVLDARSRKLAGTVRDR